MAKRKTIKQSYIGKRVRFVYEEYQVSGTVTNSDKVCLFVDVLWHDGTFKTIEVAASDVEEIKPVPRRFDDLSEYKSVRV